MSWLAPLYAEAMDAVCRRGNVNTHHSHRGRHMDGHPDLVVNQNNQVTPTHISSMKLNKNQVQPHP